MRGRRTGPLTVMMVAALLGVAWLVGCAGKLTFETPRAEVAYHANQVLLAVGAVQTAVINAEAKSLLTTEQARTVLLACRVLDVALPAVPDGWRSAATLAAWEVARQQLLDAQGQCVTGSDGACLVAQTPPETWQAAARAVWAVVKARVPALTTDAALKVVAGALDGALAAI